MKTIFYSIVDTELQKGLPNSRNLDFNGFVNSFKKFHSDIELKIFDQHDMQKIGVNYYNAKGAFGLLLSNEYDLVVNVDADHIIMDRLDEILKADYDVSCPANFNVTDNLVAIKVKSGLYGNSDEQTLVSVQEFLQGGLIASPNKDFWRHYNYAAQKYWGRFVCKENDILNLVAYLYPYKVKVLDGGFTLDTGKNCYYGCSIYPFESKCYIENGKIMCEGLPVKAYHFAHGSGKKLYSEVFNAEVSEFIKNNIIN